MVSSGVPSEFPFNQTAAYAQRLSWREAVMSQKDLAARVGVGDLGGSGPVDQTALDNRKLGQTRRWFGAPPAISVQTPVASVGSIPDAIAGDPTGIGMNPNIPKGMLGANGTRYFR